MKQDIQKNLKNNEIDEKQENMGNIGNTQNLGSQGGSVGSMGNKGSLENVYNPRAFDNIPLPFYSGAVHPDDLLPIYENWQLNQNEHGNKGEKIEPQNLLFQRNK